MLAIACVLLNVLSLLQPIDCRPGEDNKDAGEKDPDYGKTWIYFPDGDGNIHVANLTEPPYQGKSANSDTDVHFQLYTQRNKDIYSVLELDPEDGLTNEVETGTPFNNEYFDIKKDVKILTHGWKSSGQSPAVTLIKDAYLYHRDVNVVVVDWEDLASNIFYFIPAANTQIVGKKIARMVDYLITEYAMTPEQFHIIGHSLGAHVSGYAGSNVKAAKVGRITGLDPAGPGFEHWAGPENRLDPDDAQFVDIVHTCAGVLGFYDALGHADFYPNGGTPPQPGCEGLTRVLDACSHSRAYELFAESIYIPRGFPAVQCHEEKVPKCEEAKDLHESALMGDAISSDTKGVFYLQTNGNGPYAKNIETNK